ncbi:ArnT family glycosyltransferase [Steroidobacter sp.]|uniref:ArnT family glycosyltransferase n=1 Tax=Steroidobacter sp. TaxID=1978227 RepID=UPI001A40F84C|nr:glycosyltransferase family 39 protein [Steroidobacter sp.]MBL8269269.1 glycosyltransferase family 39 protein [Steroidobacter sp.]
MGSTTAVQFEDMPLHWLFRPGRDTLHDVRLDYGWLIGFGLLLIATGIGLRDPWPADEPRFALIVRDMVATGEWLLPRVGGDVYADKPPLFFWLMGLSLLATGSLRIAFLLPSLLAGIGCVLLIYDLGRRLWTRETGLAAGLALLLTIQFVWQARQAQIDATLCFWCVLSLYGLLRHLLIGPAWRWYVVGWAAAGFGVITKGVGFLPLLLLIPFAVLRAGKWSPRAHGTSWLPWLLGPLAFIAAVGVWLVPMLLAAHADPMLAAYRDEILFHQTVGRYTDAWHHRKPVWYFAIEVIPALWMPLTLLLPWLTPQWRRAWREGDLRIALPLCWIVMVVVFFSLSSGKRGVYVLPAVPALALVCAPYLIEMMQRRAIQFTAFVLSCTIAAVCLLGAVFLLMQPDQRAKVLADSDIDAFHPLLLMGLMTVLICIIARARRGFIAYAGVLTTILLVVSYWVNPVMNDARSGADFISRVERTADPSLELGFISFKEQYLLNVHRAIVHFGHARWREADQEAADAALWLSQSPRRQLVVSAYARNLCFTIAESVPLGEANRIEWFIVRGAAHPDCVARGTAVSMYHYSPPTVRRELLSAAND